jgi:hypothetical protein
MIAFKTRPILPFALLYVLGLAILGLANFVWRPAASTALVVALAGCLGAELVAVTCLLLHKAMNIALWWCGLVGALTTGAVTAFGAFVDNSDNSVGAGFGFLIAVALFAVGALAPARTDPGSR